MLCNRLVKYESSIGGVNLKAILSADYNDDYQHNSMQHHLSLSDMDEDDIY